MTGVAQHQNAPESVKSLFSFSGHQVCTILIYLFPMHPFSTPEGKRKGHWERMD